MSQESKLAVLKKNPWVIWAVSALFAMYQFMLQASASVIAGNMGDEFNLSSFSIGLFAAIYYVTYIAMQVPAGNLIDLFAARRIMLLSLPLTVLMCLLLALSDTVFTLFLSRLLMGLVSAPAVICTIYIAGKWFSPQKFVLALGLTELACMLGGGAGQKVLSLITESFGWRYAMYLCVLIGLLLWVLVWFFISDYPKRRIRSALPAQAKGPDKPSAKSVLATVFSSRDILAAGVYAGLSGVLLGAFAGMWGIPYLRATYNISITEASTGTSLMFAGIGVGSIIIGMISNKIGMRKPVMLVSTLITLLLMTFILYTPLTITTMCVLLFIVGFNCCGYVLSFTVAKEIMPQFCQATAIGFVNMMSLLIGAPILQPLIGWLLRHQGDGHIAHLSAHDYEIALIVIPISLLLSLFSLPFIRETYCQAIEQDDE